MLMPVLVLALVLRERGEEEQAARSETSSLFPASCPGSSGNSVNQTEKVVAVAGLKNNLHNKGKRTFPNPSFHTQKQTLPFPSPVLPRHADNKRIPAQTTFSSFSSFSPLSISELFS